MQSMTAETTQRKARTYQERFLRYLLVRLEVLPPSHVRARKEAGIETEHDDQGRPVATSVIMSFHERQHAENAAAAYRKDAPDFWSYEVVDAGGEQVIERPVWF